MKRSSPRRIPLSNVDTAWLRMEDPTNLMMVSGVLTFDGPIEYARLKALLAEHLLKFDRFRMRVVEPLLPFLLPVWAEDPHFDLDAHLHRVALPAPGDQVALQAMVSDLMSMPLDSSKPLWQFHFVENYGSGCALICRLHHAIADGMALIYVLLSMTTLTSDAALPPPPVTGSGGQGTRGRWQEMASLLLDEGLEVLARPSRLVDWLALGGMTAATTAKMVLRWPDPPTLFKGPLGVRKRAAWSQPLPLADVKAIRRATGSTVNDILLTAISGALRRYMACHGQETEGVNFRAAVPVNLRRPEEAGQLGNKFGLVFLSLPVGIADPAKRLAELKRRMDGLKDSLEAPIALAILGAMGMTPTQIQHLIVEIFGSKITGVMTNVPGPPVPLYFAGRQIEEIMFWVPQSGRAGMGVSIISYAGQVVVGIATDAGLVPDPEAIIEAFYEEFETLKAVSRDA